MRNVRADFAARSDEHVFESLFLTGRGNVALRRLRARIGAWVGSSEQRPESIQKRWMTQFLARLRGSERCCSPP